MPNRFLLESHRKPELNGEFSAGQPGFLDEATHPYFGRVLYHLDQLIPEGNLTFVVTTSNVETLPEYGPNVVACILEDELSRETMFRNQVGAIFRCYPNLPSHLNGVRGAKPLHRLGCTYVVAREFLRGGKGRVHSLRCLASGERLAPIFEVPIGYYASTDIDYIPFEKRETDTFFSGSISHLEGQRSDSWLARIRPKSLERLQMKAALDVMRDRYPGVRVNQSYTGSFLESAAAGEQRYLSDMMNARFCLAPRGGLPHTYRFFEAIRFGTIPIGVTFPDSYGDAPFIRLDAWKDLPDVIHDLLTNGQERMLDLHQRAFEWWENQAAETVIAAQMKEQLTASGLLDPDSPSAS